METMPNTDIAVTLSQIGAVAQSMGNYENALGWIHQSLEMKRRMYGKDTDHPEISTTLHFLGTRERQL